MSFERRFFGLFLAAIVTVCAGCTPPTDPMLDLIDSDLKKTKIDDLSRTMDFISSQVRYEQKEFRDKVSTGLNRWVSYSDEKLNDIVWKDDSLAKPLFESNSSLPMLERHDEFSYLNTDAYYLQESAWVTEIANRVMDAKNLSAFELYRLAAGNYKPDADVENPLAVVMEKLHPDATDQQAQQLANALQVFDWVSRNIQLLPESNLSEQEAEDAKLKEGEASLAASGVPGTGYQRYPWQVLLYGRGDYVDRAKLLMLGLHHANIESVMLATKSESGDPTPWVVGVAIGDDYYLFDTKMALPIPGEKPGTIATLADVRKNPELLTSLDLTNEESLEDDTDYWVKPDQVKDLVGLVYVTPESISKRMLALESSLVGDFRLKLAFSGDDIASRIPKSEGVEVKAWGIGFETHQFRQAVREALEQTSNNVLSDKLRWHFTDESYIDDFIVYRTARARFIKGKFSLDPTGYYLSAIQSCQRLNYTDKDIANLGSDKTQQARLGIRKDETQDAQAFTRQVQSVQQQMRLIRRDAGYFLSQCLFDNGSMNAAANWLAILESKEDAERWKDGVTYLLGRSLEKLQEYDRAIEVLSDQKLEQSHGNLIRARLLKKLIAEL